MSLPTVWAVEPNAAEPIIESYGYLTDIIPGYREGMEQRVQLRRHPTGSIEFAFLSTDLWEAQRTAVLLQRRRAQPWIVPLWQYRARPTADIAPGATEIAIVTASIPFTDPLGLGPYAVLWRDSRYFEVVALNAIYPSRLELASPVVGTWPASSVEVLPARVGRLYRNPSTPWLTRSVPTGRVRFDFECWSDDNIVPVLTDDYAVLGGQVQPV